jgi:hypothetical protein
MAITENSYKYIQSWLKQKYKDDPMFKKKQVMTSSICQLRRRIVRKTDALILDVLAECYTSFVF